MLQISKELQLAAGMSEQEIRRELAGGLVNKCGNACQVAICSWMTIVSSGQLLQQRFRLLQILRIKPFGEPAVDP
jgi:hypothetical protein